MDYLGGLRFNLVGWPCAQSIAAPGDALTLVREPTNEVDRNAITDLNPDALHTGYIDANSAAFLAPLLTTGAIEIGGPRLARPEEYGVDGSGDLTLPHGWLYAVFGGRIHARNEPNTRSLGNFPTQANGAEILRLACCFCRVSAPDNKEGR